MARLDRQQALLTTLRDEYGQHFSAVQAQVLLLEGSNGLPFLKASLRALARVLPHVVRHVEFPKLDHGGANNPSQMARASNPALVAQELRRFFARA